MPEYILLKGCVTKNNHVPLKELEELLRAYVEKSQKNNIRSVQCRLQEAESEETSKMNNLIENALKYAGSSSEISIFSKNSLFGVKDNGPGVTAEDQSEIFKKSMAD